MEGGDELGFSGSRLANGRFEKEGETEKARVCKRNLIREFQREKEVNKQRLGSLSRLFCCHSCIGFFLFFIFDFLFYFLLLKNPNFPLFF